MEGLDAKILRILYAYYEAYRGAPKMAFADLVKSLGCDDLDLVYEEIATLQTVEYLEGTFLEDGQAGLVWLTPVQQTYRKQPVCSRRTATGLFAN